VTGDAPERLTTLPDSIVEFLALPSSWRAQG